MHHPTTGAAPSGYRAFYDAVASAQLALWLPRMPATVLDLSLDPRNTRQIASAGHCVIRVIADVPRTGAPEARDIECGRTPAEADGAGAVFAVVADNTRPRYLADASVDAVVADGVSRCLASEAAIEDMARVLRPGGRLLLCVDSLVRGMSRLAEQSCWAQLSDVPRADVVLVPSPDGSITRCFSPEQLHALVTDAGLELEWIRPRTVLSPSLVERMLQNDSRSLRRLVDAELSMEPERAGETAGIHLVASARRPDGRRHRGVRRRR